MHRSDQPLGVELGRLEGCRRSPHKEMGPVESPCTFASILPRIQDSVLTSGPKRRFSAQVFAYAVPIIAFLLVIMLSVGAAQAINRWLQRCARPTWSGVFFWYLFRVYARLVHRTRYRGLERVPSLNHGPIIIVANHTGGADPFLIQAACPFEVRWMMLREINEGITKWFTEYGRIILVERNGRDFSSTREALRHLHAGGAIGIFAEGGIERPAEVLRKFQSGVGFLVRRSGAIVVPVWISGTPRVNVAFQAVVRRSHARVQFSQPMRFDKESDAEAITRAIRDRIAEMSGWPATEVDATEPLDVDRVPTLATA